MFRPGQKMTAAALNGLATTVKAGKGAVVSNQGNGATVAVRTTARAKLPHTAINVILLSDDIGTTYIEPFTPVAIIGLRRTDELGLLAPLYEARIPTADDIADGLTMGIVQQGISIEHFTGYAFAPSARCIISGHTRVRVRRIAGDTGDRLSLVEGQEYAGIGTSGDLVLQGEEGDPTPTEDDTHLATALFMPQGSASAAVSYAASIRISGGQELVASSSVYGLKRKATLATAATYPQLPRRATATATVTTGAVSAVTLVFSGAKYAVAPAVTITGDGTGATATATLGDSSAEAIAVTNVGSGYAAVPVVSFTGGGGTGMAATAIVSLQTVIAVEITNSGRGYTSVPTVVFTAVGGGTGAAATVILAAGGVVSVAVGAGGSGYTAATITIAGPPALAATTAFAEGLGWGIATPILGAALPSGVVRLVNDPRSAIGYALSTYDTAAAFLEGYSKMTSEAATARGCVLAWIPAGVIA